jgi:glycine cleavage system H lipoate-binding protein/formate hydrogenlyase subunit 6/NADH:ubiquinone oxidoreductase subunit I
MVTLTIDGKKIETDEDKTILQAAQQEGIHIPYFCYHEDMEPYGGCRLCMVEVTDKGMTRLQPSCAFPVKEDIEVKTDTERLKKGRKIMAELLLARCPDVDSVKNLAASLGVTETRFKEGDSDCVLCGQCVRVCRNVVQAGAIDFVDRGKNRHPGTPFDLPSDVCVGCGSCAYVCPTGAMKMEYENVLRWRQLPGPMRKCRYMRMGLISYKVCPNDYQCWNCEVDQGMEDLAKTHPVFLLKESRAKESEMIDNFELLFDRMYDTGHTWSKRMNGTLRVGIDDFTRRILGQISDIQLPPVNTELTPKDPLCLLFGNGKSLHIYAPVEGRIADINPDILDNPGLISMAPYGRGWILTVSPKDVLETSRNLLSGRAAREWLTRDAHEFHELVSDLMKDTPSREAPLPKDFAAQVSKSLWSQIERSFFERQRSQAGLQPIERIRAGR